MFTYCNGGVLPQNPILTLHFNKLVGAVYNRLNFDAVLRAPYYSAHSKGKCLQEKCTRLWQLIKMKRKFLMLKVGVVIILLCCRVGFIQSFCVDIFLVVRMLVMI